MRKFAQEVVGPKVYEMDEAEQMDPAIIKGLFDQGVSLSVLPIAAELGAAPARHHARVGID